LGAYHCGVNQDAIKMTQFPSCKSSNMAKANNGKPNHRLEEATATLQQAMATMMQNQSLFMQNQALFVGRVDKLEERMDRKFAEVDRRLDNIEALLRKMFAELPEKVFWFRPGRPEKTVTL
jgi:hypothetical protein